MILYWRLGGFGDTLLSLIPATWLRDAFGPVTVAVDRRWLDGVARFGFDALDEAPLSDLLFADRIDRLTAALAPFDQIVALRHDPDGRLATTLRKAHRQVTVVPPLPSAGIGLPYPHWLTTALAGAMGVALPATLPLPVATSPWVKGEELLLVPCSGGREKWLTTEQIDTVMAWADHRDLTVTLVTGPSDSFSLRSMIDHLRSPALSTLADRIASAALVVGADAGPTHFAALLGAPTVTIFHHSDPVVWRPFGRRARWLVNPTSQEIQSVFDSILTIEPNRFSPEEGP